VPAASRDLGGRETGQRDIGRRDIGRAKVNLFLHVLGRRPDGYHLLDSLAVFPPVGDVLTAEAAPALSLRLTGPFGAMLATEPDNLVLRAARALAASAGVAPQARLTLDKRLPVASGIGGGSADAAAALRLLARLWGVPADLPEIAATLGADVPVCLASRPARMRGVGEQLVAAPALPDAGIALVNPGGAVATALVFRARQGAYGAAAALPAAWPDAAAMARDLAGLRNDLQPAAVALHPPIGQALDALAADPACLLARMSGSGATCFGLYATPAAAARAAAALARPGWWCWGGALTG
jgi:4-diphosphocytidyl-2-C-methyl-D-erythritol kinase